MAVGDDAQHELATAPFSAAIADAERLIASADFAETDADLAEGYDYLAGSISAILQLVRAHNKSHPYFVTSTGPYSKMGLDNPDTIYYHAVVEPNGTYVVRGKRGTTTDLSFQVLCGEYSADSVPGGDEAFDDRRLDIADDGSFELTFGPPVERSEGDVPVERSEGHVSVERSEGDVSVERSDPPKNYFVLPEGATTLAVREVYSDWDTEERGRVDIERVDTVGTAPDEVSLERMKRRYSTAAKMLTSRINTWFNFPKWFYLDEPVNTFTAPRQTPGGLATQFSSVGHFDLPEDKAMIVTVPRSQAPYQGFQLGSLWYISLDYVNHQTSLNSDQAQVDPDGKIRMVISARDPGVANWIETTGRRRGIIQFRWQRTDSPIGPELGPTAEVVDIDDVPSKLPYYDDNKIDADGWQARIAARQRSFARRLLG
ncbi:hypothetical protein [Gordonia sp. (in: high G+C Gram-positive bacteria)]|uniref:hypothetical protein n=1 Tax=Gordonia sp. (in: high G+C Gram-positive bacteria) TaxID=84139 RepID=UPI0039E24ADD